MTPKKHRSTKKNQRKSLVDDVSSPKAGGNVAADAVYADMSMELARPLSAATANNILASLMGNTAGPVSLPPTVVADSTHSS